VKSIEEILKELFKPGTPQYGIIWGIGFVILAFLFLFIGFWKTLFVVLLFIVGLFIGAVKDKETFLKNLINKIFPPKNNS
jgi:uncharacterized membrane protein